VDLYSTRRPSGVPLKVYIDVIKLNQFIIRCKGDMSHAFKTADDRADATIILSHADYLYAAVADALLLFILVASIV